MNAEPEPTQAASLAGAEPSVDARSPWLGLASFTEETRAFFFGREEEVAELARRVQRKRLTVLFGKSGLGKTSILRAGLVPRLRAVGYCPVYVRIDYGRSTPEPAEQIKEAIRRAAGASGEWTRVGVAAAGESLWEFLHHRDDVLRDETGATLTPLLIFDQFEEIFTLGQSDEFGRARAARFIEELADLVENRAPQALEARWEVDETAAERFDFERSDYRVLIALREDYLAPLESLRNRMPSLAQNRLRLAPMTGAQALAAVLRPGKGLVTEEVAAAIVRFVAGGAEIANAEVEPSLLSLICRELNDARLSQGRAEISIDLLAGSHESILAAFYERSLADQPAAVRRIIEDELLTESGFRENVAEETLLKHFEAAGAAPEALATLVNRRLLRIEERLDVRRVELTHDVLCGIVRASRDQRHEREAREAAERVLEEQRGRERAARQALKRARTVATGCILLAAVALLAAGYAYISAERAHRAEQAAQQSRALAVQARTHAEQLLGYLSSQFDRQLESFGQLKVIAEFTESQIDYFHSLPRQLRSAETVRNGAMALIGHARALGSLGDLEVGRHNADEAIQLLEGLRRGGHGSEATLVALGTAYMSRCMILDAESDPGGPIACRHALTLLQPLATGADASLAARRAYLQALVQLSSQASAANGDIHTQEQALQATQQAMRMAAALGARDLANLEVSALYTEAAAWRVLALVDLGRDDEALRVGTEALGVADRLLAQRPWYRGALVAKEVLEGTLGGIELDELDPNKALAFSRVDRQTARTLVGLDPKNLRFRVGLAYTLAGLARTQWARGHLDEAEAACRASLDAWAATSQGGLLIALQRGESMVHLGSQQAIAGDLSEALRTAASAQRLQERFAARAPPVSFAALALDLPSRVVRAEVAYQRDDFAAVSRMLGEMSIGRERRATPRGEDEKTLKSLELSALSDLLGHAEYRLGHFATAARAEQDALTEYQTGWTGTLFDKQNEAKFSTWLAMALARQGKLDAAARVIGPVVRFEQGELARDHGDVWVRYHLARALYAQSLADPARRTTLRRHAATLLQGLPPSLQRLHDVRQWRQWVMHSGPHRARAAISPHRARPGTRA